MTASGDKLKADAELVESTALSTPDGAGVAVAVGVATVLGCGCS